MKKILKIAKSIKGAKRFVLQGFIPDNTQNLKDIVPYTYEKMLIFKLF